MANQIVADGFWRLRQGQKALTTDAIEKKYAAELAAAGPYEKKAIQERRLVEFEKHRKMAAHQSSAGTLW